MSRLVRGLWQVEVFFGDHRGFEPAGYAVTHDDAQVLALTPLDNARRAVLRRVPGTRAPWESRAPFEASDPPNWEVQP